MGLNNWSVNMQEKAAGMDVRSVLNKQLFAMSTITSIDQRKTNS